MTGRPFPAPTRRTVLAGGMALATTFAAAARAQSGTAFVFANSSQYDTLDPHKLFDVARVAVRLNLYDSLYRWLDNPPALHPWLAESCRISADSLCYTYKLRQGALFHDGSEVTAEDVVYSIERLLGLGTGAAALFGQIVDKGSTRAADKYTVTFTLKQSAAIFASVVPELPIVNSKLVKSQERDGDWGGSWLSSHDAGSGSYQLDAFDPATGFTVKRFDRHFAGWQGSHLLAIDFRAVLDPSTVVLGLMRGDYAATDGYLPFEQIQRLKKADTLQVLESESMRLAAIQMNNTKPPFDDVHFRRAMAYAYDYDGMIDGILSGSVVRNPVPIPSNCFGYPKGVQGYTFDLDKARAELKQAKSVPTRTLTIVFASGQVILQQQAEVLQNGLRQLGLKSELKVMPWASMQPLFRSPETSPDFFSTLISTYYPDPNNWIGEMYSSKAWGTFKSAAFYKNDEVDKLLATGMASTDEATRASVYEKAARLVLDDSPGIFIYNSKWFGPYSKRVSGVRFCPIGNGMEMRWMGFA